MGYCRECGAETTQSYCKQCGIKTKEGVHETSAEPEEALTVIESLKVMYRYYTYPENRKWLTFHILLILSTAGGWVIWLLYVWLSIWDGTTSKEIDRFIN